MKEILIGFLLWINIISIGYFIWVIKQYYYCKKNNYSENLNDILNNIYQKIAFIVGGLSFFTILILICFVLGSLIM